MPANLSMAIFWPRVCFFLMGIIGVAADGLAQEFIRAVEAMGKGGQDVDASVGVLRIRKSWKAARSKERVRTGSVARTRTIRGSPVSMESSPKKPPRAAESRKSSWPEASAMRNSTEPSTMTWKSPVSSFSWTDGWGRGRSDCRA